MALQIKQTNAQKSPDARWFDYDADTKVLLNPLDSEAYQIALERMRRRLARNDEKFGEGSIGVIEGEKSEHENHCMLLATFILKGWQGALDTAGKEIGYSEEIGTQMLRGDAEFFLFVLRSAAKFAEENRAELAEIVEKQ